MERLKIMNIRTIGELQHQISQLERQLQRASYRALPNRLCASTQSFGQHAFENQAQWGWQHLTQMAPHTDILELDDQYLLEIALPGVVRDDVENVCMRRHLG